MWEIPVLEPSLRASFLYIYGIPLDVCFLLRGSGADEVETMLLTTRKAFPPHQSSQPVSSEASPPAFPSRGSFLNTYIRALSLTLWELCVETNIGGDPGAGTDPLAAPFAGQRFLLRDVLYIITNRRFPCQLPANLPSTVQMTKIVREGNQLL